ncbi:MAG: hypothetical protein HGA38_03650 [Candidatus Moranbacteria bacterium]|nr:hypothetical protein [Candidatus Moranbacteria bacterium]
MRAVTVTNERQEPKITVEKSIKKVDRWGIRLSRGKKEPVFVLVGERDASIVRRSTDSKTSFFVDRIGLSRRMTDSGDWRYRLVDERSGHRYPNDSVLIRLIIDSGTDDSCKIHYDPAVEMISVQTYAKKESAQIFTRSEALAILKPGQPLFAERHGSGIDKPYGCIRNHNGRIEVTWSESKDDLPVPFCTY